jgi:hypothetical protein
LAREVRLLHDRVERFTRLHTDLAAEVSEHLGPELAAMRQDHVEQLGRMQAQLDEILETVGAARNRPVDWPALAAAEAEQQWPILADWIGGVLVPWYQVTRKELPDCWALHRQAVVELSWLRGAHVQAYLRPSQPHLAGEWHCRWRPSVMARIEAVIPRTLCRPGEHLVSEEESTSRRAPARPARPPERWETRRPGERPQLAAQQLAEPRHWRGFYEQAVAADLEWRRQRQQEAHQPADWPAQPADRPASEPGDRPRTMRSGT